MTHSTHMDIMLKTIEKILISQRILLSRHFKGRIHIVNRVLTLTIVTFQAFINNLNHNLHPIRTRLGSNMCEMSIERM